MTRISKAFTAIRTRALADGVGQVAGVAGEQQERNDEDRARRATGIRCRAGGRGDVHGAHRDDDLVDVVVEGAQELRPQESLEAAFSRRSLKPPLNHSCLA